MSFLALVRRIFAGPALPEPEELTLDDVVTSFENGPTGAYVAMRYGAFVLRERVYPIAVQGRPHVIGYHNVQRELLQRMNDEMRPRVVGKKVGPR